MKILVTAATLLLASTSAFASSAAIWECGQGITAISNKGEFSVSMGKAYKENGYPNHGIMRWDFRENSKHEIQLNGKTCKRTN